MIKTKSFLRREEYSWLSRISLDGKILDIGGSKKSGYHELIKGEHTILTGNIDASYGIDVVFDAQEKWPFEDGSFDAILLMNILEHLYKPHVALAEAQRVLKQGGKIVGVAPFMFNVHGSPDDYFRYTRSALETMLADAGFGTTDVTELGTGAFSVIYHALIGFARWNWLATLGIAIAKGLDAAVLFLKPNNKLSKVQMPLGYAFIATKA